MRTVRAHFDGKQVQLDEPCTLEPDTPLLVTVLPKSQPEDREREEWLSFSHGSLAQAYGEDEPEYSPDLITDPNPEYEGK